MNGLILLILWIYLIIYIYIFILKVFVNDEIGQTLFLNFGKNKNKLHKN